MKSSFFFISFLMFFIVYTACDSQFSKYEKRGRTDVEKYDLKGTPKEVVEYWFNRKDRLTIYNKWGFKEEVKDYDDGKLSSTTYFTYDEYGLLVEEKYVPNDKNKEIYDYYFYDNNHNLTLLQRVIIEDGIKESPKTITRVENFYKDDILYKQNIFSDYSTPESNYYINTYDQSGKLIKKQRVNFKGILEEYMSYDYYADGSLHRTKFLYPDGNVRDYWEEIYSGNDFGENKKPIKRIHVFTDNPYNYWVQEIKHNPQGDVILYNNGNVEGHNATYEYDNQGNWIKRKEIPLKIYYDDGNGGSVDYVEQRRVINYW